MNDYYVLFSIIKKNNKFSSFKFLIYNTKAVYHFSNTVDIHFKLHGIKFRLLVQPCHFV